MAETISLFGLEGYAYGLCAAAAAALMMLGVKARRLPAGTASLFGVLGMLLGVVCARALYCAVNWSEFVYSYENPWLMLRWFDGGMSMAGLIIGLLAAAALTARVMKIRFAQMMDAVCVPFGLMLAVLRFGEQFTDLGAGAAVDEGFATANLPWLFVQSRMGVMVQYRMNVWLYEMLMGLVLFAVAIACIRRLSEHAGDTAIVVLSLYGASQILLESMRDDGHMLIIFLRVGQLAAFLLPAVCCGILSRRVGKRGPVVLAWAVVLVCVGAVVALEFSLDGRLTFGTPTLARDWSLMAIACAGLFIVNCLLLRRARKA